MLVESSQPGVNTFYLGAVDSPSDAIRLVQKPDGFYLYPLATSSNRASLLLLSHATAWVRMLGGGQVWAVWPSGAGVEPLLSRGFSISGQVVDSSDPGVWFTALDLQVDALPAITSR